MRDDEDEDEDDEDEEEEAAAAARARPLHQPSRPSHQAQTESRRRLYGVWWTADRPASPAGLGGQAGLKSAGGIAGGWRRATNAQMTSSAQVAALRTKAANTVGPSVAV